MTPPANSDNIRENIRTVLERRAQEHGDVPVDVVRKIFEHESALQFDEKRHEAGIYIRNLVAEYLATASIED